MSYEHYLAAEKHLNEGLIRRAISLAREGQPPRNPHDKMAAMQAFLLECGHPEKGIPAIHIAGTSGKGSVAAATAGILHEAGLKVGLHVSPYLQAATEKIWISGRFVSPGLFADLVSWIMPAARKRLHPETAASIHGMASVIVALEAFRRAGVDVMVFEAGCGGRFDLSNVLESAVGVVTNVGLDHIVSLGPGIDQIAWHKAGIARSGVPLITGATGLALDVIRREAAAVGAPLVIIPPREDAFAHNRALAEAAALAAGEHLGVPIAAPVVERGLGAIRMAGRNEQMPTERPRVILDGAHNPEKLKVAVDAALACAGAGRRVCLFGAIGAKAGPDLVRPLEGRFDRVIATEPRVYAKTANPAAATAALLSGMGCPVFVEPDPQAAFQLALEQAGRDGTVLVTGSFYLLAAIRERYYPKSAVVVQRTSFPVPDLEK